jgi:IS30 family transposase
VHIELRKQVGHWERNTVIGANHKGAIVTMVERKSGFSVIVKVSQKTSELVSRAIIEGLRLYIARVITLTYDNGKEFAGHIQTDLALNSTD